MPVHRHGKRNVVVVALGIVFFGLAVVVVRDVWLTDSSEVVPIEEAVDRYRGETTESSELPTEESTQITEKVIADLAVKEMDNDLSFFFQTFPNLTQQAKFGQ